MLKRQSFLLLISSFVILGTILLQMGLYATSIFAGCDMKFNVIVICHSWLRSLGLTFLEYVLDGLVVYTLLCLLWKVGSQFIQTVKMKKRIQLYKEQQLTVEMNQLYGGRKESIIVLSYPAPMAITMGFLSPKIILTTGLINLLSSEELKAVIYHEEYHKKNRDPLKLFLLSLSSSILWYIPIQNWFLKTYRIIQEVLADEYAIKQQDTTVNLGSALLKMLKTGKRPKIPVAYVSFADTSVNYRIEYMLNPVNKVSLGFPFKVVSISVVIFSVICGLYIYALA